MLEYVQCTFKRIKCLSFEVFTLQFTLNLNCLESASYVHLVSFSFISLSVLSMAVYPICQAMICLKMRSLHVNMPIRICIHDHRRKRETCSHIVVIVTSLYFFSVDHLLQAAARVLALKVPAERSQQISKTGKRMQKDAT